MYDSGMVTNICDLLFAQAKKCQTVDGATLLLAIKDHIQGRELIEGCEELWQAADVIASPDAYCREIERLTKELEAERQGDCHENHPN